MIGFDFDGVISAGVTPPEAVKLKSVIITGRTVDESKLTLAFLKEKGLWLPVFFNPESFYAKSAKSSATHKARVCQLLGVTDFFEDCPEQADIIAEFARGVRVHLIKDGKETDKVISK